MSRRGIGLIRCVSWRAPHPNPPETSDRPEGEGTDWGKLKSYADLKVLL